MKVINMRKLWDKDEIELLRTLYIDNGLSLIEIYPIFTLNFNRSLDSIKLKIKRIKLQHTFDQKFKVKSRNNTGEKNGMYGKSSLLKGLCKENSKVINDKSIKTSITRKQMFKEDLLPRMTGEKNGMFGKESWNKNLNKYTDYRIFKYGKKISIDKKINWINKSDDEKNAIIKRLNVAMIQSKKPTKIEIKVNDFLSSLNLSFKKNYIINNFLVDFYLLDYNIVLECDGDYWHANPKFFDNKILTNAQIKNIDRDIRKNKMLREENIKYLRFWEYDIKYNFPDVENKIKETLN
jgi:very-short-patch-repair endonuclease